MASALPELAYAEERVEGEDEPADERDGRVEHGLSEVRVYGKRWGYGSGKWEGSIEETFGGRAKGRGGEESGWKEVSLSNTGPARAERTACDGDVTTEVLSGVGPSATRSAAIIALKLCAA